MDVGHRTGDRKYQFLSEIRFTISKNIGVRRKDRKALDDGCGELDWK
jgi:hypothetical protein